ncbi:MAG: pyridoxal phosphate-dependent aminotransferase [Odoribacteraceae bacterium]|jgi:aspartate aminotransferase|nr:pyridoxal phosphate-dependent aminotransferase [Odoribacteraceae bacterium]
MPQISEKGKIMPASPIRRLVPLADKAKERGIRVYHLNIGQPDIHTPEIAIEAMKTWTGKVVEYTNSVGNASFRKKLAAYYRGVGVDIDETNILVTTGGSEAITFAFMATLDPGDEVITPEPFYANYTSFATICGVTIKTVPSFIENGFALPPVSEFERLITPRTKGIVIVNPGNPTGYLYSREELEQVADIVKRHDLFLYTDEVYREFCYDGLKHFSATRLEGIEENVIMVDSVSKRYSECGARVGMLISRNKEVLSAVTRFCMARLSPPALGQLVAEASLDTPPEYFAAVHHEYVARRDYMVGALNRIPGVVCPMPRGAFYTVVKLPVKDADDFARWLLEEFDDGGETVMVAPASGFYSTPGRGKDEVRVAYVLEISRLKRAIEILGRALDAYPGRIR